MASNARNRILPRIAIRGGLVCAAILALSLLAQGRATAQNAAGPMAAAAPSSQSPAQSAPTQSAPAKSASIAGKPNLAGTWALNADQSDNPMEKMREAREESGDAGGGGRGMGGGMGGGGGMGSGGGMGGGGGQGGGGFGGRRGGQNGDNAQNGGGRGARPMAQLVIEQTPTSAKVSDANGRVVAEYIADPNAAQSTSTGANTDTNAAPAKWQDTKLVSTVNMPNGGTTTRSYEMSPDNKQLIVTTTMENKRFKNPVTIKQVYDPVYANTGRN